jgi:hypothetical protein
VFSFIGRLPQPAKTLYVLIFLAFVVLLVTFVMDLSEARRFALVGVGTLFFLLGLCASLNINHTADGMASAIKEYRPMGADYSKSFLSTPLYARLFGIMAVVVGSVFAVAALVFPNSL